MKRITILAATIALALTAATFTAATAQAHYTSEYGSEQTWQGWFSGRCGNGTLWRCDWRGRADCAAHWGDHSRYCQYSFGETYQHLHWYGFHGHYRTCSINGRSEHGYPEWWDENCG